MGASTLSRNELFHLHLSEVAHDWDDLAHICDGLRDDLRRVKDENTELRELVAHMRICMDHVQCDEIYCDRCRMWDGDHFGDYGDGRSCDFDGRMRQLGIEVE